jgi:DNA-binding transcriptional ArsR family regulator
MLDDYSETMAAEKIVEKNIMNSILCSNTNRVGILHLLKKSQNNEMQAEKIAYRLGISHRTVLYHLEILQECGLIEVRKYRKKGSHLIRSVWGLSSDEQKNLDVIFSKIQEVYNVQELDKQIAKNVLPR